VPAGGGTRRKRERALGIKPRGTPTRPHVKTGPGSFVPRGRPKPKPAPAPRRTTNRAIGPFGLTPGKPSPITRKHITRRERQVRRENDRVRREAMRVPILQPAFLQRSRTDTGRTQARPLRAGLEGVGRAPAKGFGIYRDKYGNVRASEPRKEFLGEKISKVGAEVGLTLIPEAGPLRAAGQALKLGATIGRGRAAEPILSSVLKGDTVGLAGRLAKLGRAGRVGGKAVKGVRVGTRTLTSARRAQRIRTGRALQNTVQSLRAGRYEAGAQRLGLGPTLAAGRAGRFAALSPNLSGGAKGTFEAIKEDPEGVAKRTPSAVLSQFAGLYGIASNVGIAGARALPGVKGDPGAPLSQAWQMQYGAAKDYAKFLSGDPKVVKEMTEKYGLSLHMIAGIPLARATRPVRTTRRLAAKARRIPRVESLRAAQESNRASAEMGIGRGAWHREPPPVFRATERRYARKRVAGAVTQAESRLESRFPTLVDPVLKKLRRVKPEVRDKVYSFLASGTITLKNPEKGLKQARAHRVELEKHRKPPKNPYPVEARSAHRDYAAGYEEGFLRGHETFASPDLSLEYHRGLKAGREHANFLESQHDYQALKFIEKNPEVLSDPDLIAALEERGAQAEARRPSNVSEERARMRAGQEQRHRYGVADPDQRVARQAGELMKSARALVAKANRAGKKAAKRQERARALRAVLEEARKNYEKETVDEAIARTTARRDRLDAEIATEREARTREFGAREEFDPSEFRFTETQRGTVQRTGEPHDPTFAEDAFTHEELERRTRVTDDPGDDFHRFIEGQSRSLRPQRREQRQVERRTTHTKEGHRRERDITPSQARIEIGQQRSHRRNAPAEARYDQYVRELDEALDMGDRSPTVRAYAWFSARQHAHGDKRPRPPEQAELYRRLEEGDQSPEIQEFAYELERAYREQDFRGYFEGQRVAEEADNPFGPDPVSRYAVDKPRPVGEQAALAQIARERVADMSDAEVDRGLRNLDSAQRYSPEELKPDALALADALMDTFEQRKGRPWIRGKGEEPPPFGRYATGRVETPAAPSAEATAPRVPGFDAPARTVTQRAVPLHPRVKSKLTGLQRRRVARLRQSYKREQSLRRRRSDVQSEVLILQRAKHERITISGDPRLPLLEPELARRVITPPARIVRGAQRADKWDEQAARYVAEREALEGRAAASRMEGKRLAGMVGKARRKAGEPEAEAIWREPEFQAAVKAADEELATVKKREELPDGQYVRALDASRLASETKGTAERTHFRGAAPEREARSTKYLLTKGLVDRRWEVDVAESLTRPLRIDEQLRLFRTFRDDEALVFEGRRDFDSSEIPGLQRKVKREHRLLSTDSGAMRRSDSIIAVSVRDFDRAFTGFDGDALGATLQNALNRGDKQALARGERYYIFDREAVNELHHQIERSSKSFEQIQKFNRIQAYAVLGTSPGWLLSQFPATLIPVFASVGVGRFMQGVYEWHRAPQHRRTAYMAMAESPFGIGQVATDSVHGIRRGMPEMEYNSLQMQMQGGFNARMKQVPQIIRILEKSMTVRIRRYAAAGLARKELARVRRNYRAAGQRLVRNQQGFYAEANKALREMRGMTYEKQLDYFVQNPRAQAKMTTYLRDMLGDWRTLTSREEGAAALAFFYPFLRWSMRFTWRHFPQQHPIKATILAYLGYANTREIQRLLGYYPNWTQTLMSMVLYTGKNPSEAKLFNVAREMPGGNALVESGFVEGFNSSSLRVLQPGIGALTDAMYGYDTSREKPVVNSEGQDISVDQFTGEIRRITRLGDVTNVATYKARGALFMNDLLRMATPARLGLPAIFGEDFLRPTQGQFGKKKKTIWQDVLPSAQEKALTSLLGGSVMDVERVRTLEQLRRNTDYRADWLNISQHARSQWKKMPPGPAKDAKKKELLRRMDRSKKADAALGKLDPRLSLKHEHPDFYKSVYGVLGGKRKRKRSGTSGDLTAPSTGSSSGSLIPSGKGSGGGGGGSDLIP